MPRGTHGNHAKGAEHYAWNGGRIISTSTGYAKIKVGRGHPLADSNGYAYEHLLVWVAAGNPRPTRGTVLHHRNGNKTDNRLENLELLSVSAHHRHHVATMRRDPATGRFTS